MDYEHDDRRAADVPGAAGAEGSGLPAGRDPLDADSSSSRSPEVRVVDSSHESGPGPSGLIAGSDQTDDLFDAMFLTGGMHPPAFAAVDHDLGFPPPQAPDLASAFLAALDAIDDRRFVTPVPEEPPAAPVAAAASETPVVSDTPAVSEALAGSDTPAISETQAPGEPVYELRPQSRLELESTPTSESADVGVDETRAESAAAEWAVRLPWDTGRVPVAGLLTAGNRDEEREAEPAPVTLELLELPREAAGAADDVEESATVENAEPIEEIEEAAYYAAGIEGDADDDDDAEAAAMSAAEAEAELEEVAAAAAEAEADAEASAAAARAEADAEAEALAKAIAEAEQAELEAAIAAEAALHEEPGEAATGAPGSSFGASIGPGDASDDATGEVFDIVAAAASDAASSAPAFGASLDSSLDGSLDASLDIPLDASLDASIDDDVFATAFDAAALDATLETESTLDVAPDASSAAPFDPYADADVDADADLDLTPEDDDFELEPSIGMDPIDAAPMAFDGPDAFAPAPAAAAEAEPEPESDEVEELQDFVVFSLGDMRCVVPIRNVVEVGRIPDAAPVPNAPAWLYGLGNLRGQVLSLIDLRAFFNIGRIKASAGRMVVLRGDSDDITAGVMVDQVHQIVALSPSRFKEAPAELPLPEKSTGFVWGACDYGNFTMIGLDVDGVLGVENMTEEAV